VTEDPGADTPPAVRALADDDSIDPVAAVSLELQRKSPRRRLLEGALSLGVTVIMFLFVVPAVSGSHYSAIWQQISTLSIAHLAMLTGIWALAVLAYSGVMVNCLPGLRRRQAITVNLAGSAVSNVVPFGGAVGVGATYAIDMSWGFSPPTVTLSILVSGVWNVFVKLALPVIALVLLLTTGRDTGQLVIPAILGVAALITAIGVLALIMRSEALAIRVAELGQRLITPLARRVSRLASIEVEQSVLDFRRHSIGLLRRHWVLITIWVVLFNLIQYLLLLACVRSIGLDTSELGWIEVFAAFAFARLLETIPITPSGVGFVETGAAATLISFGGHAEAATAAVFLFRGFTYLLEIPTGAIAWGVWASMRRWRRPIGAADRPA
jgi:putative heme transporter